jgi:integrase
MAFIRKRVTPKGKVCYTVVFTDSRGQRRERSAGSTKKAAENLRVRIERELAEGTFEREEEEEHSFAEFCDRFLAAKEQETKKSTVADYESVIRNHLKPFFGGAPLSEITPIMVEDFVLYLEVKGCSPTTRRKALRYLRIIIRRALSMELIVRDPTLAIKLPRVEKRDMDYLSPEEVGALLAAAVGDLKVLLATACYTGLRQGEIIGLRWKDVDFKSRVVRVSRTYHHVYGFGSPKSKAARRSVPMIESLVDMLSEQYERHGCPNPEELVFPSRAGTPKDCRNLVQQEFEPLLLRAGLRRVRFHDLRHTFASLMVEGGCDIKTLQVLMGHSSITTTMNDYTHLYNTAFERAVKGLESVISGKPRVLPLKGGTETIAEKPGIYAVNGVGT